MIYQFATYIYIHIYDLQLSSEKDEVDWQTIK